jgi:sugar phosphate permease
MLMALKRIRYGVGKARGKVLILLCLLYFITYVDRVNISTAGPYIRDDLGLSNTDLGLALGAFSIPYALFQVFGGLIGDKFGPRKVLGIVGVIWSGATAVTGAVTGLVSLFIARLALGFGEGASFPTATQAMSKWMPEDQRGFAQGIVHSASRIGNAITPPVVALLIFWLGWRGSFVILGVVSFFWVIVWFWYFRDNPSDHPGTSITEIEELPAYTAEENERQRIPVPWRALVKRILPVTLVDFCYGWVLWFYLTWLPSFFEGQYGLSLGSFALFTSGVLIAGVIADTLGGVVSDSVLRRTGNLRLARRANLLVGFLGAFVFLVPSLLVQDLAVIAVCLSLGFFFLELNNAVLWAIPMDIAPNHAGTAGGLMNTGFGVAGIISPPVFGFLVDQTGSWQVPFVPIVALLFIGALLSLRIDPTRRVGIQQPSSTGEAASTNA